MELVVLVDEQNNEIGTAPKDTVHTKNTPLHRGFSLFLFNAKNELLLTRRARTKKTFPGVWTNTVCGHPAPKESVADAARRRLNYELGFTNYELKDMKEVAPYRYRFTDDNGMVENEICPILVAHTDVDPQPHAGEIEEWRWIPWQEFLEEIKTNPRNYSPWSAEETQILTVLRV
ncbi:isopentenyl-diphosphate Delta-isomerase [Candidatus Gottesmanbacteria bacterium]|nr:isopentenyl-diphosphate Delta-isomerase [Candidatus Gottesmanbacteria bacterium]